jgi:lysozyme
MARHINDAGRNLIKHFEGFASQPYLCPAGVLTIGYGHTREDVDGDSLERWAKSGRVMSLHEADVILTHDLTRFEEWVEALAPHTSENQFAALVSFAFNLGTGALARSALLKYCQAGQNEKAAREFIDWDEHGKVIKGWVYASGKMLPGLVKRRAAERALFLTPVTT